MLRTGIVLGCVTALVSLGLASACTSTMDDCLNTSTCPPSGGTSNAGDAGKSSASGKSGASGSSSGGGANGGDSGTAGGGASTTGGGGAAAAGEAGAGGAGGVVTLPCDGACTAPKPICDEPSDTCVECLAEADCVLGAKKKCDTDAKACVACLASADCSTAAAAKCDAGSCVKCTSNDDCTHIAGKTVCDTVAGECVECTGKDYASCGMSAGKPLVCDSKTRACSVNKEHSAGLCGPCVSDAQCELGKLCVKETFGSASADVGYFCFWKKGDTGNGAPTTCLPDADPYAKTLVNQTSIDGATGDICGLRSSTCVARNQISSKDCATSTAADDQKCGFAPAKDSKCVQADVGVFRCTMTCLSNDDCPGTTCNTGANPAVCEL